MSVFRFLLVHLHMDKLERQRSIRKVRHALRHLPEKLYETYNDEMKRIATQSGEIREVGLRVLAWICHAVRPLRIEELQHALAVEPGDQDMDDEGLISEKLIISSCAGLVSVDPETGTIRLVHYTLQEFFNESGDTWFPHAQQDIARTCVTYLSFNAFAQGSCSIIAQLAQRLNEYLFLDYAARNWGHRLRDKFEETNEDVVMRYLYDDCKVACASQVMLISEHGSHERTPTGVSGAHLAACFDLTFTLSELLENGMQADSRDESGRTPLSWSAQYGKGKTVRLLLARHDVERKLKRLSSSNASMVGSCQRL